MIFDIKRFPLQLYGINSIKYICPQDLIIQEFTEFIYKDGHLLCPVPAKSAFTDLSMFLETFSDQFKHMITHLIISHSEEPFFKCNFIFSYTKIYYTYRK